jgi:thiamine pyrophosphate-dependent acetolactate synthase large subunit-like protein
VHGDGSFGLNALGLDTAVRHNVPILVVVSLNGGWTADPQRNKPGRNLGYTRFDKMAETLGCYGEYVERPDEIRPALDRAQREVDCGSVGTRASRRLPISCSTDPLQHHQAANVVPGSAIRSWQRPHDVDRAHDPPAW